MRPVNCSSAPLSSAGTPLLQRSRLWSCCAFWQTDVCLLYHAEVHGRYNGWLGCLGVVVGKQALPANIVLPRASRRDSSVRQNAEIRMGEIRLERRYRADWDGSG